MNNGSDNRLTAKQNDFLDLIEKVIEKTGQSPTVRELMAERGDKSLRTVMQYLGILERKGMLRRQRYKKRSIEVLRNDVESSTVTLPVLGAAGCDNLSVCAEPMYDEHIKVDRSFLQGKNEKDIVLIRAIGSSMVDAGVKDNDLIVTEVTSDIHPGEKVIAIINGMAILKQIAFTQNAVVLKPMSPDPQYKPIIMTRNFKVFGKMVNVIKNIPTDELSYESVTDN